MKKQNINAQTADMNSKVHLKIDWATHEAAKYACENWHYSKCTPSTLQKLFKIGIWENNSFIGVIIFGHGANPQIGSPYGLSIYQVCELTRVAIKTGHFFEVSKYISIAIKFFLKKSFPNMKLIVSYADEGQCHHGGIYQAGNWIYVGKSKGVSQLFYKGKPWHAKALRTSFPNLKHSDPNVKKLPPSDKHKYLMPLDDEMRKKVKSLARPYPKRASSKDIVAVCDQQTEGGENPTDALQYRAGERT